MTISPTVASWLAVGNDVPQDRFLAWASAVESEIRERLSAATTIYLRATGNDANDGRTPATALLTPGGVVARIVDKLDAAGQAITVDIGSGNFGNFNFARRLVGGTTIKLKGAGSANTRIGSGGIGISIGDGIRIELEALELYGTTACASILNGGHLLLNAAAAVRMTMGAAGTRYVNVSNAGYFYSFGPTIELSGNAQRFLQISSLGAALIYSTTFKSVAATAFSAAFLDVSGGSALYTNSANTKNETAGAFTGKKYTIDGNGTIYSGGWSTANMPGDVAGTTSTGGEIV